MSAARIIAASVAGFILLAVPVHAHKADRAHAPKPAINVIKQEQAPAKAEAEPRICLFSVGGKKAAQDAATALPKTTKRAAEKSAEQKQKPDRTCAVAAPPAPTPLG